MNSAESLSERLNRLNLAPTRAGAAGAGDLRDPAPAQALETGGTARCRLSSSSGLTLRLSYAVRIRFNMRSTS